MPTVLITGCSPGFGLETSRLFLDRGWNVVARMRAPDAAILPASERLRTLQLDVTDPASVDRAAEAALRRHADHHRKRNTQAWRQF